MLYRVCFECDDDGRDLSEPNKLCQTCGGDKFCPDQRATCDAVLGAAVRSWAKAVHYDIAKLKLMAQLRRKHQAGDEIAGLYELIAAALEESDE